MILVRASSKLFLFYIFSYHLLNPNVSNPVLFLDTISRAALPFKSLGSERFVNIFLKKSLKMSKAAYKYRCFILKDCIYLIRYTVIQ